MARVSGKPFNRNLLLSKDASLYLGDTLVLDWDSTNSRPRLNNVGVQVASGEIGTAELADDAVTADKLATAVLPSHVVKFAGEFTTAGGDADEVASVSGVVATDIVVASILDNGTNNVTLLQSAAGTDQILFTMSGDPSTDCVISYAVFRAVA